MAEEQKSSANIQELLYDFACRITRLFQYLTEDAEYREYIFSKQKKLFVSLHTEMSH